MSSAYKKGFGPWAKGSQLLIDEAIAYDPAISNVQFTVRPEYSPRLMVAFGKTILKRGEVPRVRIGPMAFVSRQELIDTLIHEEMHVRIALRESFRAHLLRSELVLEENYVERVTQRFMERRFK